MILHTEGEPWNPFEGIRQHRLVFAVGPEGGFDDTIGRGQRYGV